MADGPRTRDDFAIAALTGLLGATSTPPVGEDYSANYARVARLAYALADAMVAEQRRGENR